MSDAILQPRWDLVSTDIAYGAYAGYIQSHKDRGPTFGNEALHFLLKEWKP